MTPSRRAVTLASARRSLAALVLAGLLLPWAAVSTPSAWADHHRGHEPVTRLQVVVNYVHIVDDGDWWGKGEFRLGVALHRYLGCQDGGDPLRDSCGLHRGGIGEEWRFSASSGTFQQLDRIVPGASSDNRDPAASAEAGIALHSGEVLSLSFRASESDPTIPFLPVDFEHGVLPRSDLVLRESGGWSVGRHSKRMQDGEFDITVYYEVRRTPLPDLVPHNLRQFNLDDGRPVVCASALNQGERPSGPFQMALHVDGAVPSWGTFQAAALAVSEVTDHCFLVDALPPGPHRFALSVDEPRQVTEMNETNNRSAETTYALRTANAGQPGPAVGPAVVAPERAPASAPLSAAQPDLAVTALRVRGEAPGGQNGCDPGRNQVTVVIKNLGTGAAANFAVRLVVDNRDNEARNQAVTALEAGQELEVRFDGVDLNRGEHRLTATVDARQALAELNEANNERTLTVRCSR
ncbi:MAG TPA: CARDB domain-containing protein [Chloroflexota bacterium]|nr:CARDB domain-containing protein [Chloroflexota bacterium]